MTSQGGARSARLKAKPTAPSQYGRPLRGCRSLPGMRVTPRCLLGFRGTVPAEVHSTSWVCSLRAAVVKVCAVLESEVPLGTEQRGLAQ